MLAFCYGRAPGFAGNAPGGRAAGNAGRCQCTGAVPDYRYQLPGRRDARAALQATTGILGIFRKRDNVQMTTFTVRQTSAREPVIYANEFCAAQRNLKFIALTYEADIQLNPGTYADPQGYYISYQTRNRNAGINNINSPDQTGFTFYLEFPALQRNGTPFVNSSPHFGPINGEYVSLGDPFTFPFGGTDPDGDELRYSMITPLNQKGTNQNSVSPAPYPDVSWIPGYSAANAIQGSPALGVDARTGQLSVTATQLGLFVFAVKVEEYRSGIKIGEVSATFSCWLLTALPKQRPNRMSRLPTDPHCAVPPSAKAIRPFSELAGHHLELSMA